MFNLYGPFLAIYFRITEAGKSEWYNCITEVFTHLGKTFLIN